MLDQLKPQLDCPNCGEKNISYPCRHCGYDPDMRLEPFWSPEIDQAYEDAYSDDAEPVGDDGYPLDMDDETKAWLSTNR
jgi:hypothetical protein